MRVSESVSCKEEVSSSRVLWIKSLKHGPKTQKNTNRQKTHNNKSSKTQQIPSSVEAESLHTHTFLSVWSNWRSSNLYITVTLVQNSKTIWICWKDYYKLLPIVPSNIQAQIVSCTCPPTCWDFPGAGSWQPQSLPCCSWLATLAALSGGWSSPREERLKEECQAWQSNRQGQNAKGPRFLPGIPH